LKKGKWGKKKEENEHRRGGVTGSKNQRVYVQKRERVGARRKQTALGTRCQGLGKKKGEQASDKKKNQGAAVGKTTKEGESLSSKTGPR